MILKFKNSSQRPSKKLRLYTKIPEANLNKKLRV
jgi:hypothetical protein